MQVGRKVIVTVDNNVAVSLRGRLSVTLRKITRQQELVDLSDGIVSDSD